MSRNFELLQRAEWERRARAVRKPSSATAEAGIRSLIPTAAVLPEAPKRVDAAAEISRLVHALFIAPAPIAPRMVVFAPVDDDCAPAQLCTRVAAALAARALGSVCVVDANLGAPEVHQHCGVPNDIGLAEALQDTEPIGGLVRPLASGMGVLTAGNVGAGWEQLLLSEAMAWRLSELRESFEYVLLSAPPLASFPHAQYFGRLADGLVMVLEAHSTRRDLAGRIKIELEQAEVRLLGAVLNNRTFPIPESLYRRL